MRKRTPESYVSKAVADLLTEEKIRWWRMNAHNTIIVQNGKRRRIRGHAKGTPDFLAAPPVRGLEIDHFPGWLWIECKAPGKSPTAEQLQFADEARNNGEFWLCVDDVKILQEWLKENRCR